MNDSSKKATKSRRARVSSAATISALAVAASTIFFAAPAQATTLPSTCASGTTCMWRDSGYVTGSSSAKDLHFEFYIGNFQDWNYGQEPAGFWTGNTNDSVSSTYNNGNTDTVYLYKDSYENGYYTFMFTKEGDANLNNGDGIIPSGYNDALSSGYYSSCTVVYNCG